MDDIDAIQSTMPLGIQYRTEDWIVLLYIDFPLVVFD